MKFYFRILIALYSIIAIAIGVFCVAMTLDKILLDYAYSFFNDIVFHHVRNVIIFFIISLLFVFVNIGMLLSGILNGRGNREISRSMDGGDVIISLNAIETIALNVSRKYPGVRDVKSSAKKTGDIINISIKMVVLSDTVVPSLSADIQQKVKSTVESTVGIKVGQVKMFIENVQTAYKGRVE